MKTWIDQEQISALLSESTIEEHTFFDREYVVCYLLPNGFTIFGRGLCRSTYDLLDMQQIDALLSESTIEEHTFFGKDHVVCYLLPDGTTVVGRAACIDTARFNLDIGREVAREDAITQMYGCAVGVDPTRLDLGIMREAVRRNVNNQLWQLEGYSLHKQLKNMEVL